MRNGDYHWGTDIVETTPYRKDPRTLPAMDDGVVIEENIMMVKMHILVY